MGFDARVFWRLALINIASNLTTPLASLIDAMFLGHLQRVESLAGAALGSVIFDYLYWSLGFLRMSILGLTAQASGSGERQRMQEQFVQAFLFALLLGGLLFVFHPWWGELAFSLLQGEEATKRAAWNYFRGRIVSSPWVLANMVIMGWLLGLGRSAAVLRMTALANLAHIGMAYLLVTRLSWGSFGAGRASAFGDAAMSLAALPSLIGRDSPLGKAFWRSRWWRASYLAALFRLQRDLFLRSLGMTTLLALFTNIGASLGAVILASNTLLFRVYTSVAYISDGGAYAVETLTGRYAGAGERAAIRKLFVLALAAALAFTTLVALGLLWMPRPLFGTMTHHEQVIAQALADRFWLCALLLVGAAAWIYDGLHLGLTQGKALRDSMAWSVAAAAPLLWFAATRRSNDWLWAALLLFTTLRSLTLAWAARPWLRRWGR